MEKKVTYNNGQQPLVMAWVGRDDPNRGDSKASIGLAKLCAEMVQGRYVYVDEDMLNAHFPKAKSYQEQVEHALREIGQPDILIGKRSGDAFYAAEKKPMITLAYINESLSIKFGENRLVPHHLTQTLLDSEGQKFDQHYPHIKGELVALMIGNDVPDSKKTLQKLNEIARCYDEVTFFICPARRAEEMPQKAADHFNNRLSCLFNTKSVNSYMRDLLSNKVHVIYNDYLDTINGYNPYLGLLERADHIVVSGQSYSLVSEALYTGKNIYTDWMCAEYVNLVDDGYITPLNRLASNKPFPTRPMPRLDVTQKIADMIVDDFKNNKPMTY